jgi:Domain of unknown function (DUF4184)
MPFTISHAAAVLPFSRLLARWRLLSATVIGSMVPDFGLFLPWRPPRVETHSAVGLLTFCLPLGLATFWIFQQLMKRPIMEILPDASYTRWHPFAEPADLASLSQWVLAACGVLAGAVTHLVWDGFTHEGARGVRMIPILDDPIVDFAGRRLVGARLLQDVSSLIGLIIVLALVAYGLRGNRTRQEPRAQLDAEAGQRCLSPKERHHWAAGYVLTSLALGLFFLTLRHPLHLVTQSLSILITNCAVAALRGFAGALLAVSFCLQIRLRANS